MSIPEACSSSPYSHRVVVIISPYHVHHSCGVSSHLYLPCGRHEITVIKLNVSPTIMSAKSVAISLTHSSCSSECSTGTPSIGIIEESSETRSQHSLSIGHKQPTIWTWMTLISDRPYLIKLQYTGPRRFLSIHWAPHSTWIITHAGYVAIKLLAKEN